MTVTEKQPNIKKKRLNMRQKSALKGYAFISVWIIGFAVFTLYPLIQTFIFSFNEITIPPGGGISMTFAGLNNYYRVLYADPDFTALLGQYFTTIIIETLFIISLSLIIAMLLNTKFRGVGIFRTIYFLPVIITSGPVISLFIEQGVAALPGMANVINLDSLQLLLPAFLFDSISYIINSFTMILWYSGVQILIYLSGLQKIDRSMYEAARIDGASKWEVFWKLTLPILNPIILIVIIYTVIMQSISSLSPIITKIHGDMFSNDKGYGFASAMAWIYFIVMVVVLAAFLLIFKKKERKKKVKI